MGKGACPRPCSAGAWLEPGVKPPSVGLHDPLLTVQSHTFLRGSGKASAGPGVVWEPQGPVTRFLGLPLLLPSQRLLEPRGWGQEPGAGAAPWSQTDGQMDSWLTCPCPASVPAVPAGECLVPSPRGTQHTAFSCPHHGRRCEGGDVSRTHVGGGTQRCQAADRGGPGGPAACGAVLGAGGRGGKECVRSSVCVHSSVCALSVCIRACVCVCVCAPGGVHMRVRLHSAHVPVSPKTVHVCAYTCVCWWHVCAGVHPELGRQGGGEMIQGTLASLSLPAPPPSHQGPRAELLGGRRGVKDPRCTW